jgi:hypothetical protein
MQLRYQQLEQGDNRKKPEFNIGLIFLFLYGVLNNEF